MTPPPIPATLDSTLRPFLTSLMRWVQRSNAEFLKKNSAEDSLMLVSPNKSVYRVTVDNSGVLQTELVQGEL